MRKRASTLIIPTTSVHPTLLLTEGNEFEHMEYTPYRESWVDEGTNKNITGYRFTSKELDTEIGLYYFGARYLDPLTSRWANPDPAFEKYLPEASVDAICGTGIKNHLWWQSS